MKICYLIPFYSAVSGMVVAEAEAEVEEQLEQEVLFVLDVFRSKILIYLIRSRILFVGLTISVFHCKMLISLVFP